MKTANPDCRPADCSSLMAKHGALDCWLDDCVLFFQLRILDAYVVLPSADSTRPFLVRRRNDGDSPSDFGRALQCDLIAINYRMQDWSGFSPEPCFYCLCVTSRCFPLFIRSFNGWIVHPPPPPHKDPNLNPKPPKTKVSSTPSVLRTSVHNKKAK